MAKPRPLQSRNDLPEPVRRAVLTLLQARLADTLDLASQVKQAHWNVKGPQFMQLHEMFDELAAQLHAHADDAAERSVALGGVPLGTARYVSGTTTLDDYPDALRDGKAHLRALADRYAAVAAATRAAIDAADKHADNGTADLFTGQSRALDKALWLIEAHLR